MAEIGKTTEALSVRTAEPGDDGVRELPGSRLVIAQGPGFLDRFMADLVMPRRVDTAQLALSAMLQNQHIVDAEDIRVLVKSAWAIADEFVLQEESSLREKIGDRTPLDRYWEMYLNRDKSTSDLLDTLVEESHDYHLRE